MIELAAPVLIAFVDFVVKGFVILLLAFAVDGLFRKANASLRHFIWVGALIAVLLLPLASAFVPQLSIPLFKLIPADGALDLSGIDPDALGDASRGGLYMTAAGVLSAIIVVYLLGVLAVLGWQMMGRFYAHRIRRQAKPVRDERLLGMLASIRRETGCEEKIELLESEAANAPFSASLSKPAVILPLAAELWPESVLRAVLTHEVAHIKRRDLLARLLAQLACCVNWFNPLAWFALRRVLIEQEIACDNYVLVAGSKPSEYAQSLLAVANIRSGFWDYALAAIGRKEELKKRLLEILKPVRSKNPVGVGILVSLLLAAVLMLVPLFLLNIWDKEPAVMALNIDEKGEESAPLKKTGLPTESLPMSKEEEKTSEPIKIPSGMDAEEAVKAKILELKKQGASQEEIDKFIKQAKAVLEKKNLEEMKRQKEKERAAKAAAEKKEKEKQQKEEQR